MHPYRGALVGGLSLSSPTVALSVSLSPDAPPIATTTMGKPWKFCASPPMEPRTHHRHCWDLAPVLLRRSGLIAALHTPLNQRRAQVFAAPDGIVKSTAFNLGGLPVNHERVPFSVTIWRQGKFDGRSTSAMLRSSWRRRCRRRRHKSTGKPTCSRRCERLGPARRDALHLPTEMHHRRYMGRRTA
jgi:hypothetical protein